MLDRDGNREIEGNGEYVSAVPETLVLTPDRPAREVALELVDPLAPGEIRGLLVRAEGDTIDVWVEAMAAADSLAAILPAARGRADAKGAFSLKRISPGLYRLIAFCDLDRDGKRDEGEAAVIWGELTLGAAETRDVGEWRVPACVP